MVRLTTCKYCGKLHDTKHRCIKAPIRSKRERSEYDVMRGRQVWKNKRATIKDRDKHVCRWCLHKHRFVNTMGKLSVHHIVDMCEDVSMWLDDDNLITLCKPCHEEADNKLIDKEQLKKLAKENVMYELEAVMFYDRTPPHNQ